MAKVTIILKDNKKDKTISMQMESSPPFDGPANKKRKYTTAQKLGVSAFNFLLSKAKVK